MYIFVRPKEFFVLHGMVGRTQKGVLTPGYLSSVTFLQWAWFNQLKWLKSKPGPERGRDPTCGQQLMPLNSSCPSQYTTLKISSFLASFQSHQPITLKNLSACLSVMLSIYICLSYWAFSLLNSDSAAASGSLQLHLTLCDPTDSSLPGFSVHGIFQARTLEWSAIAFSGTLIQTTKFILE